MMPNMAMLLRFSFIFSRSASEYIVVLNMKYDEKKVLENATTAMISLPQN
jgi:hypothetical protein